MNSISGKQNKADLGNQAHHQFVTNETEPKIKYREQVNFSVQEKKVFRGMENEGKSVNSRIDKLKEKYFPTHQNNRSRSRKKEDIGKISNLKSQQGNVSPFCCDCYTQNFKDATLNCSQKEDPFSKNKQSDLNRISVIMERGELKSKKIKKKINDLESINDKINELISCLREEQLLQKYEGSQEFDQETLNCSQIEHKESSLQNILRPTHNYDQKSSFIQRKMDQLNDFKQKSLQGWRNSLPARPHSLTTNYRHQKNKHEERSIESRKKREEGKLNSSFNIPFVISERFPTKRQKQNPIKFERVKSCYSIQSGPKHSDLSSLSKFSKNLNEQNKFIRRICRQINYDEQVMDLKVRLYKQGILQNHSNYLTILKKINEALPHINEEQLMKILQTNLEEKDPFYTQRHEQMNQNKSQKELIQKFIDLVVKAEKHWRQKLINNFSKQGIDLGSLDSQNKGFCLKEDFVRFVCLSSKKMYNNRSIFHTLRRIKEANRSSLDSSSVILIAEIRECFCV